MKLKQIMWRTSILTSAVLLFGQMATALAPVPDDVKKTYSKSAKMVGQRLPRFHITHSPCDNDIASKALDRFLSSLDYAHCYFLQSDIDQFQKNVNNLDNQLRKGDLDFAFKVYDVLMQRLSNRVDYVDTLLDKGFELDKDESFSWKRDDAPWPADEAAWNELWRKRVKNQYLANLVGKQMDEDAAKKEEARSADGTADKKDENPTEIITKEAQDEVVDEPSAIRPPLSPEESIKKNYRQLLDVLNDNDAHWLLPLYISSFARAYDPHSDFMSNHNYEDFNIQMSLSLVGIGAMLSTDDGAAKVVRVIPGGPADKDGRLQAGDKIIAVAQDTDEPVDIMHWPLSKSVRIIRGKKGTKVVLSIIPATDLTGTTVKTIDLIRDEVELDEQAATGETKSMTDTDDTNHLLGIIKVPTFYADVTGSKKRKDEEPRTVTKDVRKILANLQTNDIEGIILDLRNNGGGSLGEAVKLTGLFIDRGPVVLVKSDAGVRVMRDPDTSLVYGGPLVVLVNHLSASASEILTAALKDYGRAVIVGGAKTHGKGTVQSVLSLDRRSDKYGALKATTAVFYRISGGSTQLEGVRPNIVIPSILSDMEIGEEHLPNVLPWSRESPVYYERAEVPGKYLKQLEDRSMGRMRSDPQFKVYTELLDRLRANRKSKQISLDYDQRLVLAREEDRLSNMIREMGGTQSAPEEKSLNEVEEDPEQTDLILDEAMNILLDLIMLDNGTLAATVQDKSAPVVHIGQL